VRDAFKSLFPERAQDIDEHVDPGEYGLEDYWCRWLCIFLFMTSVMDELSITLWMLRLFTVTPNNNDTWILHAADGDPDIIHPYNELNSVHLRIAGMPLRWKVFYFITVWVPKAMIWKMTVESGVMFLLDTSGISDVIINSVALTFILNIDEMMFQNLMAESTKSLLGAVAEYPIHRDGLEATTTVEELMAEHQKQFTSWTFVELLGLVPKKLVGVLLLVALFAQRYYTRYCTLEDSGWKSWIGGWVAKPMSYPNSPRLSLLQAFFPALVDSVTFEDSVFWQMPAPQSA
jgi:hypothetical protein